MIINKLMSHRYRYLAFAILIALLLAVVINRGERSPPISKLGTLTFDGVEAVVINPGNDSSVSILLAIPSDQLLSNEQLLALSTANNAQIIQYPIMVDDCSNQQRQFQSALQQLDAEPSLVAGIGPGATLAWRWLAQQSNDQALAISIGFSIEQPDCGAQLLTKADHGHWLVAWNDHPDDASARFVRGQGPNTENLISNYNVSLQQLLIEQLQRGLEGQRAAMPVMEVPSNVVNDTVTLFYSGDGGWRDLDMKVAIEMAKRGYPVVGIDTMRYYWQHKSPEQSSEDLVELMQLYRQKWAAKHFVLAGYSFGADVLPALYNRLPSSDQNDVQAIILLALARSGNFEIEVEGWLGKTGEEAIIAPELSRLPQQKVLCVFGEEEQDTSGCTLPEARGENLQLAGGHHFDENYPVLAERMISAIKARQLTKP